MPKGLKEKMVGREKKKVIHPYSKTAAQITRESHKKRQEGKIED
jgi:translation machinery-associated protein 16